MENPAKKTLRTVGFIVLGMVLGFIPGAIKVDEMRRAAENAEAFNLRSMADLKKQMHDEENYYLNELHVYRTAAGIRRVLPTATDESMGMTCAEEYGTPGQIISSGVRSWKPRSDGRCYAEDAQ
jgi:hypothetical protein